MLCYRCGVHACRMMHPFVMYEPVHKEPMSYLQCRHITDPQYISQSISVEEVQRKATLLLFDVSTLPYGERMMFVRLSSLKLRCTREDMIQVSKIVNGLDDINQRDFFIKAASHACSR